VAALPLFGSGRWGLVGPPVDDPLALVRIGPKQLIGGGPAGMLGHGVSLELPGSKDPLAAAFDRAPPLEPWLARVVEAEQLAW